MSSCLEIQPDRYAVVVGPKFAAEVVKEISSNAVKLPTFEFRSIVDNGVSYLLDKETFANDAERAKFEARYKNAYELDPLFVMRKVVSGLQTAACYKEWLAELFACNFHTRKTSRSLQCLLTLQSQGALLVYVHCDDIIARASGLEPVLLENEEQMERWAKGECAGFLQLHGVYSKPDTVQLDCKLYDSASASHPLHAAVERLQQCLRSRSTILLAGGDWDQLSNDPLLANFCKQFVSESAEQHSFVFSTADSTDLPGLRVCATSPYSYPMVYPLTSRSADLWKQVNVVSSSQSCQYQVVCLLVSSQTGAREISHMMFNAPGVNFALVNPVMYGDLSAYCVSVRVLSGSLHQLWHWLVTSSRDALLACGLVGLTLHGGTFLWFRDPTTITNEGQGQLCNSSLATGPENRHGNGNGAMPDGSPSNRENPQDIPSQGPQNTLSPSHQPDGGEVRHSKIIQRYKVVKKRNQIVSHGDMGLYGGHIISKACEDSSILLSQASQSKYARRGSLPPIKCGETGNALALLAERLQTTSDSGLNAGFSQMPSYVAIKRALLSDKFKHMHSRLAVPKMLLNLLQEKKLSVMNEKPNLLAYRRNSDPGSYLQHRDKARRRQLFLDENLLWIKTYGSVIDKKIQSWKQKRLQRLQREYFFSQQEMKLSACHKQNELRLMNSAAAQLMSSPLYSSLASSTAPSSLTALPQAFMTAAGSGINGFTPAPFMYQLPSTGLTPTPVLLPAPFISPYAFMGSYTTLPVTAATQPTYIVPPTNLTTGAQQKVIFLPSAGSASASATMNPSLTTSASDLIPDTKPPFSSLLAPTSLTVPCQTKSEPEAKHHTHQVTSLGSRKRKSAFPEKLSSLLQPPSDPDPSSPPCPKKFCTTHPDAAHTTTTHVSARHSSASTPPPHSHTSSQSRGQWSHHSSSHSHHHHRHHHHHHCPHHSSSTHSYHHHSHHSSSSHAHHCDSPSSPSHHSYSHNSPSPLEQCLLQPPASPKSDERAPNSPGGSPCSFSSSSPSDCSSPSHPQLWQFLLELLLTADCSHLIEWTNSGQEYEFTIRDPVQVAQLWGKCTNNSAMTYDKLARGLRYYYSKGIIGKVDGKKLTFRYNGLAKSYVQRRCGQAVDVHSSMEEMVVVE